MISLLLLVHLTVGQIAAFSLGLVSLFSLGPTPLLLLIGPVVEAAINLTQIRVPNHPMVLA